MKEAESPFKTAKLPVSKPGKMSSSTETPRERGLIFWVDKIDNEHSSCFK